MSELQAPAERPEWTCSTCTEATGTTRYCAAGACYCGHPACHAYATWVDLSARRAPVKKKPARRSGWDDREESTWIDQL